MGFQPFALDLWQGFQGLWPPETANCIGERNRGGQRSEIQRWKWEKRRLEDVFTKGTYIFLDFLWDFYGRNFGLQLSPVHIRDRLCIVTQCSLQGKEGSVWDLMYIMPVHHHIIYRIIYIYIINIIIPYISIYRLFTIIYKYIYIYYIYRLTSPHILAR